MDTLPPDLVNCITNFLKVSNLVLLGINNQDIDDEYLRIVSYKGRHKLAIKNNNLSWINEALDYMCTDGMKFVTNKHYRCYKDGKNGLDRKPIDKLSLWFYTEGLAVGQHKELFDIYAPLKHEFLIPMWKPFNHWMQLFEVLMNFNDEDFIIKRMKLMFENSKHEDLWFVCSTLAENKKYRALRYFIENYNIAVLDWRTVLYLIANENWRFMLNLIGVKIGITSEVIYVAAILRDLELMDFILKQYSDESRYRFYQILWKYLPSLPCEVYEHFKERFSDANFEPNHYHRKVNLLLEPYFCSEFLGHLDLIDNPSWFSNIIEELIQHYININRLDVVRSIINILFQEKHEQSYQMFKEIRTFLACNIRPVREYCMGFKNKRDYTFEQFKICDISALIK